MARQRKTIDVDKENLDRFEEIYPMSGAFTWFVNSCLEKFVERHTIAPDDEVYAAVIATLEER